MRQKSKFKNVRLSKELAALGWTQVGDNKWVRVYTHKGQVFPAVIWRTYAKTKTFTDISPEGWDDRIPVVAAQCSDPLEAASLYPSIMLEKAINSMMDYSVMADAADQVVDALVAAGSAKRRVKR